MVFLEIEPFEIETFTVCCHFLSTVPPDIFNTVLQLVLDGLLDIGKVVSGIHAFSL